MSYIILLFLLIQKINLLSLGISIAANHEECLGEFLPDETVVLIEMNAPGAITPVDFSVRTPSGHAIFKKKEKEIKVSFTSEESGAYRFCIKNNMKIALDVEVNVVTGLEAKDYSIVAKEEDFKPAEHKLKELTTIANNLIVDLENVNDEQEGTFRANEKISSSIKTLSISTIGIMILVGVFETIYIKKYLQNRKII